MTASDNSHNSHSSEPMNLRAATEELVNGLLARPWGQVSVSVYETGRVVAFAPWLTGHERRLAYLLDAQRPDGGWGAPGGPAGYALVPTLSATEALLTVLGNGAGPRPDLAHAAGRGLRLLSRLLSGLDAVAVPDTPAADLITVALIEAINGHLDRWPDGGSDGTRLRPPAGLDSGRNAAIRAALAAGVRPPEKLLHALEVAGGMARSARAVRPTPLGTVGASPAATAAWLDEVAARNPAHPARRFLEDVVDQHGGPVPCGYPVTVFERAWVLTTLARAGLTSDVPADQMDDLVDSLRAALGPAGTPAGDGLPADADTTSVALHTLGLLDKPSPPDPLWLYRTETHPTGMRTPGTHRTGAHFCTWPGEDGFSVTTNAHVLEAIGQHAARPGAAPRYAATATELTALLCEHQRADGSWYDRWHASPYYATACCALALHRYGGAAAGPGVASAADWLLATQRADGSWGHWRGTAEETAYAIQVLALTHATPGTPRTEGPRTEGPRTDGPRTEAIARGREYLLRSEQHDAPALWHDKDLYRPTAIVRASVLAALKLAADSLRAN